MAASRPLSRRSRTVGVAALVLAGSIALLGERGAFSVIPVGRIAPVLPGVTLADDAAMPVVTSLRSGGVGERAGLQVGDRIDRIDGRAVRDVAALTEMLRRRRGQAALRVRRGDALWTVAIDRAEPAPGGTRRNDPQDSAG